MCTYPGPEKWFCVLGAQADALFLRQTCIYFFKKTTTWSFSFKIAHENMLIYTYWVTSHFIIICISLLASWECAGIVFIYINRYLAICSSVTGWILDWEKSLFSGYLNTTILDSSALVWKYFLYQDLPSCEQHQALPLAHLQCAVLTWKSICQQNLSQM